MGVEIRMAVDDLAIFVLTLSSAIPLLVLGIAEQATARYRRQILNSGSVARPAKLPRLVALHVRTTRTMAACAAATFGTLGILFGVPILATWLLWPEDFLSIVYSVSSWAAIAVIFGTLRVACSSPSSTSEFTDRK